MHITQKPQITVKYIITRLPFSKRRLMGVAIDEALLTHRMTRADMHGHPSADKQGTRAF